MSFNAHSVGRRDVYDVPASVSPTGRERPKTASAPVISNLQTRRPPTHLPAPDNTNDPSGDTMEPTRVRKRKSEHMAIHPDDFQQVSIADAILNRDRNSCSTMVTPSRRCGRAHQRVRYRVATIPVATGIRHIRRSMAAVRDE